MENEARINLRIEGPDMTIDRSIRESDMLRILDAVLWTCLLPTDHMLYRSKHEAGDV